MNTKNPIYKRGRICAAWAAGLLLAAAALTMPDVSAQATKPPAPATAGGGQATKPPVAGAPAPATAGVPQSQSAPTTAVATPSVPARPTLSVIVLDPAHGGIDTGARGSGGLRESEVVLTFAALVRIALERSGFRVIVTREGNANPSFDDRSAIANGQRGAIFITLHVASTGTPGTARVYSLAPQPSAIASSAGGEAPAILRWDRAQIPFLDLSTRLSDITQVQLSQRLRGSPSLPLTAAVRQLRTVAAPAIAIELSSVSVEERNEVMAMGPGLAEAVAQAVIAFRYYYELAPPTSGAAVNK